MKWPLALLFSALLLSGCYGPRNNFDPFLGRSRVIPPGTGQVFPPTPYYQGTPMPTAPPYTAPSTAPPAGPGFRQSSAPRAGGGIVDLDGLGDTAWSTPKGPWLTEDDTRLVAVAQADAGGRQEQTEGVVVQAGYNNPVAANESSSVAGASNWLTPPQVATPTEPTKPEKTTADRSPAKYGYDTDYSRLRGRLEYLESQRRWKLRYIPIDGETDQYGGSVVIDDTVALADYEPGDFIAVEGAVNQPRGNSRSFAPTYRIARVKPATSNAR